MYYYKDFVVRGPGISCVFSVEILWISFFKFFLTPDQIRVIIDLGTEPGTLRETHVDFSEFRYCTAGARGDS